MVDFKVLDDFVRRMKKLGIDVTPLGGNYPWIYLDYVNGKRVKEKFLADHGFTIAFLPKPGEKMKITDISEVMKIIRKYK
jgi:hypothetical protein